MTDKTADNLEVGYSLNHYRILKKIGAGGMGEVYLAQDTKLDRKVALKILPREFARDKDRMTRFVREARSASALNHPNIITIYEIDEYEGAHFIVTEFIDGKTLNEYAKINFLDLRAALELAIQIASALNEAHTAGIVHRDVKPDNVMVRENGLVKILDFGIAKLSSSIGQSHPDSEAATAIKPQTLPGMIIGTASYMSPEQAKGKEVDARTDIFSFGMVLYEMIAGHLPFEGKTEPEIIGAILKNEPKPLRNIGAPPELEKIIAKCLRKDRDERYQSIKDVLIDLKDVKQDLEFHDKLERTAPPETEEPKTGIPQAGTTEEINRASTKETAQSNPEPIKMLLLGLSLAVLLISAIGSGYWFYNRPARQIKSIAVLPFINESGNAETEYLSDGMTETLIGSLSQLPNLNVKARSSVFRYKGKETDVPTIGKELNVQAVLHGRVTQRGDQLTLSLELIDALTENVIWSGRYDRKQADLVLLQTEIARDVSSKLKTKLSGAEEQKLANNYTVNTEAYQLYLKGRFHWNRRTVKDIRKSIEYFQQAVGLDPNYALAYAGLADAYSVLPTYGGAPSREVVPKAREAALKALSLDDRLAESHISFGMVLNYYDYDFAGAERELRRAIELNPNSATAHQVYGNLLSNLGRHDEAINEMRRALEIEPVSLITNRFYALALHYAGRYEESTAQLKKTLELDAGFVPAYDTLANVYRVQGKHAACVEEFAKGQEALGNTEAAALMRDVFAKDGWKGFLQAMVDKPELDRLKSSYILATYQIELGEKDKAIALLNNAFEEREFFMTLLKIDRRLDPLRDDPRFQELQRKMGFPQ